MSPLPRSKDVAIGSPGGPAHAPWEDERRRRRETAAEPV